MILWSTIIATVERACKDQQARVSICHDRRIPLLAQAIFTQFARCTPSIDPHKPSGWTQSLELTGLESCGEKTKARSICLQVMLTANIVKSLAR